MKMVAIGGGEIGRPGYPVETTRIDEETVRLTGKENPKALLIPTASGDDEGYYEVFKEHFGGTLGCETDVLYLIDKECSEEEMREKVTGSDIVYVGGGNTRKMIKEWKKKGLDRVLEEAKEEIVLSGVSAGAICWFKYGNSDSPKFDDSENSELIRIKGLGFLDYMLCPHYDVEEDRKPSLKNMVDRYGNTAIALDNCAALEVIDGKYRVITSKENAGAYRVFKENGEVIEDPIKVSNKLRPIGELRK